MGSARPFSDADDESVYQTESDNENYAQSSQQNPQGLGGGVFNDQSGYANISQAGSDQRKADLDGALFRGNIGFKLQSALIDSGTNTLDLLVDQNDDPVTESSTDRIPIISGIGNTVDLITILGSQRPGQRLVLYGIEGNTITIKHTAAATPNTILTPDEEDFILANTAVVLLVYDEILEKWRVLSGAGTGGAGTGTFISAALSADQITSLTVGDHVEFDTNTPPTGADGGIVLQTGVAQANGIFELKANKTYFLTGAVRPNFNATNTVQMAWFDITNATEIGRKTVFTEVANLQNQPLEQIIFTPTTDVNVELRIVFVTTPANFTAIDAGTSYGHIFEFSGQNGEAGAPGSPSWKLPARAKSVADVSNLASFDVQNDGVTLVEGNRVLLTDQNIQSENGLWEVGVVAGGFAPLTRPSDFDTDAEVLSETFVAIEEGSQFANLLYHLISNNPLTIDVSSQVWEEFAPGTSGGPDMGGGDDGVDAAGQFVFDGRIAIGFDRLKRWEQIHDFAYPNGGVEDMVWIPSKLVNFPDPYVYGSLVQVGGANQSNPSPLNGSHSLDFGQTWTASTGLETAYRYFRLATDEVDTVVTVADLGPVTPIQSDTVKRSVDRGSTYSATAITSGTTLFRDVIWVPDDSQFIIIETITFVDTSPEIFTSSDGNTWTQQTVPVITGTGSAWRTLTHAPSLNGGTYLIMGTGNKVIISTNGGVTWTHFTSVGITGTPIRTVWSEGQQKFVTVTSSEEVWISTDGITWELSADLGSQDAGNLTGLVWADDLSLWVAFGNQTTPTGGGPKMFWISNDAETWTQMPIRELRIVNLTGINGAGGRSTTSKKGQIVYAEEWGYFFANAGNTAVLDQSAARLFRTEVFMNGNNTQGF